MILSDIRPSLIIVDGSVAITGALVSAARQAALLAGEIDTILALPHGHRVPAAQLAPFADVIELSIVPLRKSVGSLVAYGPSLIASTRQLRREMRRRGCERLQLNDFYLMHGSMLRLLGFRGRIVTFIRIDPTRFGSGGRIWLAAARRCSTELVAVSRFIQRLLGPEYPSRLVYEQVAAGQSSDRGERTRPMLLFVGNFIPGKGQDDAIAAFNRIGQAYPDARLRLIGGDMGLDKNRAYREQLMAMAQRGPASDRIEFRDSSDDLRHDHADASASLNFSASESFSMTCLEASAAALPVIATRCGGPEEIVEDGKTGFLVPVGDIDAMADRMAWLLDHPDEAMAMGAAGQVLVADRFSPERARSALSETLGLPPPCA